MTGNQYTDKTGETLTVLRDPEQEAFMVRTQGDEVAGRAFFRTRGQDRIFYHTEVDEEFGGRGIGTLLVRGAVEATRAEGVQIVAVCPLVKGFLEKSGEEFAGGWRLPTPDDLSWLQKDVD
ncbi:N-acetyltransferase [Dietzia sp. NCCP-2495]|uniref:GNAT family N-acetyltransferase n=1 Tax=Dietzia sp. NCCP-2495 TaxID=2934675 RepID=UPI00222EADFB|nr:GNAT family N-acetyltransferase [Dietzia sp. NCCP-2495]GLB64790.1 N-acetyltransferase [Dietzia sp. NCCP-2495]